MKIINYCGLGIEIVLGLISGNIDEDAVRKIISRELPFFSRHSLEFTYGTKEEMIEGFEISKSGISWPKDLIEKIVVEAIPGEIFKSDHVYLLENPIRGKQFLLEQIGDARREINKWGCRPGKFGLTMAFAKNNPHIDKWINAIGSITEMEYDCYLMLKVNPCKKEINAVIGNENAWLHDGDVFIAYR